MLHLGLTKLSNLRSCEGEQTVWPHELLWFPLVVPPVVLCCLKDGQNMVFHARNNQVRRHGRKLEIVEIFRG